MLDTFNRNHINRSNLKIIYSGSGRQRSKYNRSDKRIQDEWVSEFLYGALYAYERSQHIAQKSKSPDGRGFTITKLDTTRSRTPWRDRNTVQDSVNVTHTLQEK